MFIFKIFKSSLEKLFYEKVEIGLEHLILFAVKCGVCLTIEDIIIGSARIEGLIDCLKDIKAIEDPVIIRALTQTIYFVPPACGFSPEQRQILSNLLNIEIQREMAELMNTSDYCSDLDETY